MKNATRLTEFCEYFANCFDTHKTFHRTVFEEPFCVSEIDKYCQVLNNKVFVLCIANDKPSSKFDEVADKTRLKVYLDPSVCHSLAVLCSSVTNAYYHGTLFHMKVLKTDSK